MAQQLRKLWTLSYLNNRRTAGLLGGLPAYVSNGGDPANSLVANYPPSIAAGDFLLAAISANAPPDVDYSASGWSRITKVVGVGMVSGALLELFYKIAAGGETGTQTFTRDAGAFANAQGATISRFTGATRLEGLVASTTRDHSVVPISSRSILTTGANELLVNVFGSDRPASLAQEAGWTEAFDYPFNAIGGSDYSLALHYAPSAGVGAQTTEEPIPDTLATPWAVASLALAGSGSMPTPSIAVRGSRLSYVNNASSIAFSLPAGSAAGDLCVLWSAHGFSQATPTGWVSLHQENGFNTNGQVICKILEAADISAGTVTLTFGNTYYGLVGAVSFVGCTGGLRAYAMARNASGATSRTVTTGSTPQAGDYALSFGFTRGVATVTSNVGSSLQSSSNANASGAMYGGLLGSSGAASATLSYSAAGTADYQGLIVISPSP